MSSRMPFSSADRRRSTRGMPFNLDSRRSRPEEEDAVFQKSPKTNSTCTSTASVRLNNNSKAKRSGPDSPQSRRQSGRIRRRSEDESIPPVVASTSSKSLEGDFQPPLTKTTRGATRRQKDQNQPTLTDYNISSAQSRAAAAGKPSTLIRNARRPAAEQQKEKSKKKASERKETQETEKEPLPTLHLPTNRRKDNASSGSQSFEEKRLLREDLKKRQQEIEDLKSSTNLDNPDVDFDQKKKRRKKKRECPYCHEELPRNPPKPIRAAIRRIRAKDKEFEEREAERLLSRNKSASGHQNLLKKGIRIKRPVPNIEQYFFCRLHKLELVVKPEGESKGYPTNIDFSQLDQRVRRLDKELQSVIDREVESEFRDTALKAYEKMGKNKARSTMGVMARFDTTLPGYYGAKGASVILETLSNMFLHNGKLTPQMTAPQLPLEYIQQVLVPETALRLIRQDLLKKKQEKSSKAFFPTREEMDKLMEEAKQLMKESSEFGSMVYPVTNEEGDEFWNGQYNEISDDDDISSCLTSSSESEEEDSDYELSS